MKSDLVEFAKRHLGVELSQFQIYYINALVNDEVLLADRGLGRGTAVRVVKEYIKHGLKEKKDGSTNEDAVLV